MISTHSLAKRFGKVRALEDVTFSAPDSAITTLLGANGSGKTTSLRIIGGLIRPDSGKATVDEGASQEITVTARRFRIPLLEA